MVTETNMSFSLCGPGFSRRHGGDVRHGDGRDGDAGGASPASVPLAARWEEPRVCPDGVQPAQRQPHRIHHHRAGGSTQRPQVPAPPPPLPQTPLPFRPVTAVSLPPQEEAVDELFLFPLPSELESADKGTISSLSVCSQPLVLLAVQCSGPPAGTRALPRHAA